MSRTLLIIRIVFVAVCAFAGWLVCLTIREWDPYQFLAALIGLCLGLLTVLVDVLLRGFSLRGLSAVTFGIAVGSLIAWMVGASPLLEYGDPQIIFLVRLALFIILSYLGTVIALRGRDEFQLVIPYVKFVPHEVDVPLVVVDTSALIDGRIVPICESRFLSAGLVIPQFVVRELQTIADSADPRRQARGRKGLETLNALRRLEHVDLRVVESEVGQGATPEDKLIFLAQTMKAKLLTTDYALAQRAEFQGVPWLNINTLARALRPELQTGERFSVELVKPGREPRQAVGYLADGSMVVVEEADRRIGESVEVEITGILPSAGGKMYFARLAAEQ
ncbi:MAG: twitching motility protein PilT [Verrucomicrobia bacterium]|nr:MAG: twitching motility protein PilT [Verrucomicrobiota bacterium]